jgi:hypothetical protein
MHHLDPPERTEFLSPPTTRSPCHVLYRTRDFGEGVDVVSDRLLTHPRRCPLDRWQALLPILNSSTLHYLS